MLKHKTFRRK